ncbi:MAG: 50S ribosomal protein L11 methyltransferase [Bacteroidaceae bacterium]|nr:50S ribosomal protein L11 methyltransferase [Bacteroidaceae bacterium]
MQYLYADITITPHTDDTSDILTALLANIGYESFECTPTGLKAYIPQADFNPQTLQDLLTHFPIPSVQLAHTIHTLEDKDWNAEWEQNHFDPILQRQFGILLRPRMAFGSGTHPTTYQIVNLLQHHDLTHQRVLDMGTGTGVLSIAMAQRGADSIVAIDIDPHSVANAHENLTLNHITGATVLLGDATAITGTFHTIVANIHKNILTADIPTYTRHLAPGGILIISGFLTADIPHMQTIADQNNLTTIHTTHQDGWAVMTLQKKTDSKQKTRDIGEGKG